MIPWIQVYSNLVTHPKTSKLSDLLKLTSKDVPPNVVAVGLLVSLWTWAVQNAYSGDISGCSARTIAEAARYKKRPDALVQALKDAGWLDADMKLHDWDEYATLLMEQEDNRKAKTRERVRRYREKKKPSQPAPCNAPCNVTVTPCNASTVPNQTIPNHTISNDSTGNDLPPVPAQPAPAPAPVEGKAFTAFWNAYPCKISREAAWTAWCALNPQGPQVDSIMSALENWKSSDRWKEDGGRFIPKAVNWLSEGYWQSPPPKAEKKNPTRQLDADEQAAIRRMLQEGGAPNE